MALAAVRVQLRLTDSEKVSKAIRRHQDRSGVHLKRNQDKWILDADIKGFFDNINHTWLLDHIPLHKDLKKILAQ